MPRVHEDNPRFRTKEKLCSDIALVLNNSDLSYGTKFAVLSEATWVWTEFDGKYKGCKRWSEAAWKIKEQSKELCHEHVVPKRLVIKRLQSLKPPTPNSVMEVMTKYCIGVVVTRAEDALLTNEGLRSQMPSGCDEGCVGKVHEGRDCASQSR